MYRPDDYSIQTGKDRVTGEFVAIVREFPGLSWVSSISRSHASDGLKELLAEVLTDMRENGEDIPAPSERRPQHAAPSIDANTTEALYQLV